MKKIVIVVEVRNYEISEEASMSGVSMKFHDKESKKYLGRNKKNLVSFTQLIKEFKTDDLVRITLEKVEK